MYLAQITTLIKLESWKELPKIVIIVINSSEQIVRTQIKGAASSGPTLFATP